MDQKYLAFYRQYRPQKFDEIVGQEHIVRTLINIINTNKISHAYLFCGPHGTGKTSIAKIFANTINCEHSNSKIVPCKECIKNIDRNLDLIEIDAASNTGVDDIRDLREKIKHSPTHSKYKIYIIDEVHMLSKGAFNALLKTLEEPPKHAIFILATTDPQKIPLTILSRVQRFNFKKIENKEVANHLKLIFEKEHIQIENDALELIVKLGNGSLRDALSIADQISIYTAGDIIKSKYIEELYGLTNVKNVIDLLNFASNHDYKNSIELFNNLIQSGANIERLFNQCIEILKNFVIYSKTQSIDLIQTNSINDLQNLKISVDKTYEFINELVEGLKQIKYSDTPQQMAELTLIKMASIRTHDENYVNEIIGHNSNNLEQEKPKDFELIDDDIETIDLNPEQTNDFVLNEKEFGDQNKNANNVNSFFNLSDIANSYKVKTTEINVDEILEKTSEIIIDETTKEIDQSEIEDSIISSANIDDLDSLEDQGINNDLIINNSFKSEEPENLLEIKSPKLVDFERIIDCMVLHQLEKVQIKNDPNKLDIHSQDKINFSMRDQKLLKEKDNLIKDLLKNMTYKASANDFVLFTSSIDEEVYKLNESAYQKHIVTSAVHLFGRFVHLIAVTSKQLEEAKQYWIENRNELKNRQIKPFEELKSKYDTKAKELEKLGESLFGDKFSIKEEK
ncbi:DNA polymerase III subunit gamma/tau [[Mycoplasma] anseris]|uniref:DNA polymerase III subunit gamma/tau n=1 Tax=[Mycoplasma] anseris TaxID=92400 RepID=A0A2Z4NCN4_9BACT|nr:DNA polymerase III subunit gamma/tau [[Mycoplasma] anseris]AWX69312.1 DNA polymerase III subunit gamma/tau [[Mycoplasma] anseris]